MPVPCNRNSILYVDDEPELLEIGKLFLERNGLFSVDTITSAPEALRVIAEKRYDAIISDYQMPGMDGIGFLKQVRASGNPIPFIIFTGRGREEVVIQALNEGADFYLQKGGEPVSQFAELANTVQKAILQRVAEAALRSSEENFRTLVENAPDAIYIQTNNRFVYLNTAAVHLFGAPSAEELLGTNTFDRIHPSFHDLINERVRSITVELKPVELIDEIYVKMDGTPVDVEVSAVPFWYRGENGGLIFFRDITKRKQAELELRAAYEQITATEEELRRQYREMAENEQKLRQSETRYRNVVEDQTELISRFRPGGTHVFVNEAYCRYFGKSREEIIGHTFIPDIPTGDRGNVEHHFASLTPSHPMESIEHRIIMPDGEVRWQRWNDRAIFDEKGNITEFQSVGRDITDRRLAEESLRESEERYRVLIENASVAIGVVQKKKFVLINKKATEMSGYSQKELMELPFSTFVHPDDMENVNSRHIKLIEGLEIKDPYYTRIITKSGSVRWLDVKSVRIFWNKKPATLNFFIDITEQKEAEDSLRQANRRLNMMTSITRHDINNQITSLTGFLRILEKMQLDPAFDEYLQKISTTTKQISAMIGFTKEYEKIGVRAPVWQDTRIIVETVAKDLLFGNIIVKNDLPAGTEVFADPLIGKVFYNLIDNAVRYGGKITNIRFMGQESGDDYLIVCEDDGKGVPSEEKQKIFERGFGKNTGFGLCFAREILSISGITIRETGKAGEGARFEIIVPKGAYRLSEIL